MFLCDPEAKIELPLTLWFEKCLLEFDNVPYAFTGVQVAEWKNNKQIECAKTFKFRPVKNHFFKKFLHSVQNIQMDNPMIIGPKIKIYHLKKFKLEAELMDANARISISKVMIIGNISLTGKGSYLSCPHCKKKVFE